MDLYSALKMDVQTLPEARLWQAVVLSAVEDWVFGGLRTKREVEAYLFEDQTDFPQVCESAGLNVHRLRSQLNKLRQTQHRN